MAKRYTDTTIWKKQRWFRKLSPINKLAWKYITDTCDHAGILKIDFSEFLEDLAVEEFDMKDFIASCNVDFDKTNGKKINRERIKLIKENIVWITGFIKFQYENRDLQVNPAVPAIYSALTILNGYGTLEEGLLKGYLTLSQPYVKGMLRTKDKDIDKDIDNSEEVDKIQWPHDSLKKLLIPAMQKIWEKHKPDYTVDKNRDYTPLQSIAVFICKQQNIDYYNRKPKDDKILYDKWDSISKFVADHHFYNKYILSQVEKYIQTIIQEQNNGTKKYNGSASSNGASSPGTSIIAADKKYSGKL